MICILLVADLSAAPTLRESRPLLCRESNEPVSLQKKRTERVSQHPIPQQFDSSPQKNCSVRESDVARQARPLSARSRDPTPSRIRSVLLLYTLLLCNCHCCWYSVVTVISLLSDSGFDGLKIYSCIMHQLAVIERWENIFLINNYLSSFISPCVHFLHYTPFSMTKTRH